MIAVMLIWSVMIVSAIFLILTLSGTMTNKPKVFVVSLFSNASILALYSIPSLYGIEYYFLNTIKIIPLMILLVYLACRDRSYNTSYPAMCGVFILQIVINSWHILSGLTSPYYDQLSLLSTAAELLIIIGGCNGKFIRLVSRPRDSDNHHGCISWVKFHYKEGRKN